MGLFDTTGMHFTVSSVYLSDKKVRNMTASSFLLRPDGQPFAIGTTDLGNNCRGPFSTNGCAILLVTSGCGVVSINCRRRALHRGNVVLLFYDSLFSIESLSKTFFARFVVFSYAFIEEVVYKPFSADFWDILDEVPVFHATEKQWQLVNGWWEQMEWMSHVENNNYREEMLKAGIRNLLLAIDTEFVRHGGTNLYVGTNHGWMLLNRFFFLVARHCHDMRDVSFYAGQLAITPTYLYKLCRKNLQLSPKDVIDKQVFTEIRTYLLSTDLSIKQIASELHFDDVSYLCRYFRRLAGVSPMDYRKAWK